MSEKEEVILEIYVNAEKGLKAIGEYQQHIDDLKAKQAQYREELSKGTIQKDAYRKAINETNQAIKYNTENIRILSKEIQNNVKQEMAQEGSIDSMKAKLSNLTAEYNRLGTSMEDVEKKNKIGGQIKGITASLNEQEQALGNFRRQVGNYGVATESIRSELKKLTEQIGRMKLAGQEGTAEYEALVNRASAVKDAFGDAAREIGVGASDTKGLDTMKESVSVLAGSFTALNSVQGMFADDQERMQKLVNKVQIGIGALAAATAIQNALQKESAVMTAIATFQSKMKTKAMVLETAATDGLGKVTAWATVKQAFFNAVAMANPYVLLALALATVSGALWIFASGAETAAEKQKKLNESMGYDLDLKEKQIKALKDKHRAIIDNIEAELTLALAQGKSEQELEPIRRRLYDSKKKMHDESRKMAAREVDDIEKNKNELAKLEGQLARVEKEILKNGKNKKVNVTIDGKVESGKAHQIVGILQKAIDNTGKKIEVGVGVKTEAAADARKEAEELAAKAKEVTEKAAAAFKEQKQKEKEAIRQAEDAIGDLLENEQQKRLQQINRQYDREIEDLKAKLTTEKNLTVKAKEEINKTIVALDKRKDKELKTASDAFSKEKFKAQVDKQATEIKARLAAVKEGSDAEHELKMQELTLKWGQEKEANRQKTKDLRIDEQFINEKYGALVDQADITRRERKAQEELDAVKVGFNNRIMQMQLAMGSEAEIADQVTAQKIADKQAELSMITQVQYESDAEFLNRQLILKAEVAALEKEQQEAIKATAQAKSQQVNDMLVAVGGAFGAVSQLMGDMAEDNESLAVFAKTLALFEVGVNLAVGISGAVATATKSSATVWDMIAGIAAGTAAVVGAVMQAKQLLAKEKAPKAPKMKSYATGGLITGEGSGTSDSITAKVSNGESIMTQLTTQMFSPILSSFNMMGGGVPIVTNNVASQAMGEEMLTSAFAKALQSMPQPVVSVEEIERVKRRIQVIESLRTI